MVYGLDGSPRGEVALPGLGQAGGFGVNLTMVIPFTVTVISPHRRLSFIIDLATLKSSVFRAPRLAFDLSSLESKQVFYTSKDGTRVSLYLVAKKGVKLNSDNPTLLYGYGGFGISCYPFSTRRDWPGWSKAGFAIANIRGGGEYGDDWHGRQSVRTGKKRSMILSPPPNG